MPDINDITLYTCVKYVKPKYVRGGVDVDDIVDTNNWNKLFVSGFDKDGNRIMGFTDYSPTFWIPPRFDYNRRVCHQLVKSTGTSEFKELYGDKLNSITLNNIEDAELFLHNNSELESRQIIVDDVDDDEAESDQGGDVKKTKTVRTNVVNRAIRMPPENGSGLHYELQYICEHFPVELTSNIKQFRIFLYDIETEVGHQGRDASLLTPIKIRNVVTHSNNILDNVDEVVERTVTLGEVEIKYKHLNYEFYDEETHNWVPYSLHPYSYVGGFPSPDKASEKLTLITIKDLLNKHIYTWGLNFEFETDRTDVTYKKFSTEYEMLDDFTIWFSNNYPDIFCGFNSLPFDNPYIINRIAKVLGPDATKRMNPIGLKLVHKTESGGDERGGSYYGWYHRKNIRGGNTRLEMEIPGITCLDYLKLYMKWGISSNRESYKLDSIGEDEVGARKVENPTGGSFKDFYTGRFEVMEKPDESAHEIRKLGYIRTQLKRKLNENPDDEKTKALHDKVDRKIIKMCQQMFVEYNIQDVELIEKIEKKCKLFEICLTIAYKAHENIADAFSPTKTWDSIIYNSLWHKNIIIPRKGNGVKTEKYPGAYVKNLIGKYEYCLSHDLDSLYPHIIMGWNIGPETLVIDQTILKETGNRTAVNICRNAEAHETLKTDLINKEYNTDLFKARNLSFTAWGCMYKKNKQGILANLCETTYSDRKKHKKQYLAAKSEHQKIVEELARRGIVLESE